MQWKRPASSTRLKICGKGCERVSRLDSIRSELAQSAHPEKAKQLYRFFQAFPGGYGEGDRFIGVTVPQQRKIARKHCLAVSLEEAEGLLRDPIHECRLTALFILRLRFEKAVRAAKKTSGAAEEQEEIVSLYLRNLSCVNNWDLVDSSAPYILGPYLAGKDKTLLYELAGSGELWKQRAAVIATFYFIRQGCCRETLALAEQLLDHPHDLIHKAVGWMLREIGNRDCTAACAFLAKHYHQMPRTMLRYAIEKYDPALRQKFLQGLI